MNALPLRQKWAAALLLLSGLTHIVQLAVYGTAGHVVGAAIFGGIYWVLGLFLLSRRRAALWLAAILPTIGGLLGILRFIAHPNPFSVFHVGIDAVVVPICIGLLRRPAVAAV